MAKRINKVILAYPNQRWVKDDLSTTWNLNPYTLCLLAATIEDIVKVKIVDAQFYNMSQERFKREIEKFKPDLVGVSVLCTEYAGIGHMAAELIKEVNKDIQVLLGGVHVTLNHAEVAKDKNVDYLVVGEGERILKQIIDDLNAGEKIDRIQYGGLIEDLDSLPMPAYHLIDFQKYSTTKQRYGIDAPTESPFIRIPTSRGCPVGCSFCQVSQVSGKKNRRRSPDNLIEELVFLKNLYGIRFVNFDEDNFLFDKCRSRSFLRKLVELDLKWKCNGVALFSLDEEIVKLMKKSGCQMVNIAVESGCERVLKEVIKKPIDLNMAYEKVKLLRKYKIYTCVNFIIGLPTETWDEILETIYHAEHINADYVKFFIANPLKGTELYKMAEKYLVNPDSMDWRYSSIRTGEFEPHEISLLRVYEWDRINFTDVNKKKRTAKVMNISIKELDKIRRKTRRALKIFKEQIPHQCIKDYLSKRIC